MTSWKPGAGKDGCSDLGGGCRLVRVRLQRLPQPERGCDRDSGGWRDFFTTGFQLAFGQRVGQGVEGGEG